ncbi:MAG: flagellar export chaperone FliS [Deltaproteobacteria bacterium]|nr:flagellar export chaperone FliS [Deltaproteobacteria bacterium]
MPQDTPYGAYQTAGIQTADQRTLIVMLYDGLIRFLKKAEQKIEAQDIEGAHNYLVRSREIVAELMATLNPEKGGEVGRNLKRLYVYVFDKVVEANLYKDTDRIREAVKIMSTLREGWASIKTQTAGGESAERKKISVTL